MALRQTKGFVEVLGFNLFYRTFGRPKKGTVLCLHGGPGATHDYLLPLADLAKHGYKVVFYDQLGCGRSDLPKDTTLFIPERYVEEVEGLRKAMSLGKVHIIGSSWGGMLALGYALKYQRNMKSMTTIGGLHNVPMTIREMQKMKKKLPSKVLKKLSKYEAEGDYENPEYQKAVMPFYKRHLCRLDKWPRDLAHSLDHISKPVYYTMNGPNQFTIVGNIKYWNIADQLRKIRIPTMVMTGQYDEVSPKVGRDMHRLISGSKLVVFSGCSHTPFWEDRPRFIKAAIGFLDKIPR